MPESPRATLEKSGLRVEFFWLGDRFGHTVSALRNGQASVVWNSAQGSSLGPAFQELHQQGAGDEGDLLFLSGSGGGAHWSMSVEQQHKGIAFDVAVRVSQAPAAREVIYEKAATVGPPLVSCGQVIGSSQSDATRVVFQPEPAATAELPCTLRLKYVFF